MDPDSFLNLLSPGLNEMDVDWGSPSDADFYADHAPALAWLSDGFITEGTGEDDADALSHGAALNGIVNRRIVDNASEYSSVLKLSDIASALHNFSRAAGMVGSTRAHMHMRKSSSTQSCSSVPLSPSLPDMTSNAVSGVLHSSSFGAHTMNHSSCSALSGSDSKPTLSFDTPAIGRSSFLNAILGFDTARRADQSGEVGCGAVQVGDEFKANEKESISKVSNEFRASEKELSSKISSEDNGCEYSDDGNNGTDSDDEVEYAEEEDVKPSVSHVRIIRRTNCGQGMMSSPKRMKFTHVKVEAGSSCEMASSQDDKEGGGDLKQLRKDGMSQREVHILSERQRRKSMRESFSILQSLVPKLKLKHTDRITVLTEVITYIQALRGTLEELERKKADILELLGITGKAKPRQSIAEMPTTVTYVNTSNNSSSDDKAERSSGWCSLQNGELVAMVEVTVRMCGSDVFITLNTPRRKGVWSGVLSLLQKYSVEILNANLASSGDSSFHCIRGKATNMRDIEGVDLQEKLEGVIVKELRRRPRK